MKEDSKKKKDHDTKLDNDLERQETVLQAISGQTSTTGVIRSKERRDARVRDVLLAVLQEVKAHEVQRVALQFEVSLNKAVKIENNTTGDADGLCLLRGR